MAAANSDKVTFGHCPSCGPNRRADVRGHHRSEEADEEAGIWAYTDFHILQCRGCEEVYLQTVSVCSEDTRHYRDHHGDWHEDYDSNVRHYPAPSKRVKPAWHFRIDMLDDSLGSLFSDIYRCLDAELSVPAAVATRTAFDRATELLGIDPSESFANKLTALENDGKISKDEKAVLTVLIDAGSAAAHRGWRPKIEELDTLASLVESFFHRTFVLGDAAKKLKASVPAKPTRKPKPKK